MELKNTKCETKCVRSVKNRKAYFSKLLILKAKTNNKHLIVYLMLVFFAENLYTLIL
jgi:hypothetical protein